MLKKHYIILSLLLLLTITIIVFSMHITNETLKKVSQGERKTPPQNIAYQSELPSSASGPQGSKETKERQEKPRELEFNLDQIPENYLNEKDEKEGAKDMPKEERLSSGEKKLNKQPSLNKLKELRNQRVIIY